MLTMSTTASQGAQRAAVQLHNILMIGLDMFTRTLKKMMDTKFATITNPVCKDHARSMSISSSLLPDDRCALQLCQDKPCGGAEEVTNSPR